MIWPLLYALPACLEKRGVYLAGPEAGDTACGEVGTGRLLAPTQIVQQAMRLLQNSQPSRDLAGRHILVTAGPTYEDIDAVRFIGNHSSGRQGYAIAGACAARGAEVTLVSGPTSLDCPEGVRRINVRSAASCVYKQPAGRYCDLLCGGC